MVHAPYRIAAPPAPEGPDAADLYEAMLRRRAVQSRRVVTVFCGALAGLSLTALVESPPRRAEPSPAMRTAARITGARDVLDGLRSTVVAEQAQFRAAVLAAEDANVQPGPLPCNIALPEATRLVHGYSAFPLLVVAKGERDLSSPSLSAMLGEVRRAEERLAMGVPPESLRYGSRGDATAALRYDVVLVTTSSRRALQTTNTSFEPGEVTGRAYVYDFAQHRVTCVGDVRASSSRRIEYAYVAGTTGAQGLASSLEEDLDVQVQRAIAHAPLYQVE